MAQFAAAHQREILFHGWLQWTVDLQLTRVQNRTRRAGMRIR